MKKLLFLGAFFIASFAAKAQNPKFTTQDPFTVTKTGRSTATFSGTITGTGGGGKDHLIELTLVPSFNISGPCTNKQGKVITSMDCPVGTEYILPEVSLQPEKAGKVKISGTLDMGAYFKASPTNCGECPNGLVDAREIVWHTELFVVKANGNVVVH